MTRDEGFSSLISHPILLASRDGFCKNVPMTVTSIPLKKTCPEAAA